MNEYSPERGGVAPDGGLVTSFVSNRGSDNPVALDRARRNLADALERDRLGQERQAEAAKRWNRRQAERAEAYRRRREGSIEPRPRIVPRETAEGSIEPRLRGSLGDEFPGGGLEIPPEFERRRRSRVGNRVEVDEFAHRRDPTRVRGYEDLLGDTPQLEPFDPRVVDTIPPLRNPSPYDNETDLQRRQVFDEFNEEAGANTFEEAERLRKFREHKAFWDESDRMLAEAEAPALRSRAYNEAYLELAARYGDEYGPGVVPNHVAQELWREHGGDRGLLPGRTRPGTNFSYDAGPRPSTTEDIGSAISQLTGYPLRSHMDPFSGKATPAESAAAMSALRNTRPVQYDPDYGKPGIGTRKPSRVLTENELDDLQVRHDEAKARMLARQAADPDNKRFVKPPPMTQSWHDARAARKEEHGRRKAGRWAITDAKRRGRLLAALVGSGRGGNFLGDANKRMEHEYALAIAKLKYADDPVADDLVRAQIANLEANTRTLTDPQKQTIGELLAVINNQYGDPDVQKEAWEEYKRLTGMTDEEAAQSLSGGGGSGGWWRPPPGTPPGSGVRSRRNVETPNYDAVPQTGGRRGSDVHARRNVRPPPRYDAGPRVPGPGSGGRRQRQLLP